MNEPTWIIDGFFELIVEKVVNELYKCRPLHLVYLRQDLAQFPDIVHGVRGQLQDLVDVVILAALLKLIPREPFEFKKGPT